MSAFKPPATFSVSLLSPHLARLAFWSALLTALVFACLPAAQAPQLQLGDKAQHMLAFVVLTALACLAYPQVRRWRLALALCAFGAAIEIVQCIPGLNRSGEWQDWMADLVAILVTLLGVRLVKPLKAHHSQDA